MDSAAFGLVTSRTCRKTAHMHEAIDTGAHRALSIPRLAGLLLAALFCLTACGGGSEDEPAPSPPPPSGMIGSAGGTATGSSGAQVVVPAGALAQATAIAVAQSSTGTPPLPTGVTAAGQVFAFTPHGTTFAVPATITVPFDPAQLPAGATANLYKTNASGTGWEIVPGATVTGTLMSGQVSGFSHAVVGHEPPLVRNTPQRSWGFLVYGGDGESLEVVDQDSQIGGEVDELVTFGPTSAKSLAFVTLTESFDEDNDANGYVFATNDGATYGVLTEAPDGPLGGSRPIGSLTHFGQAQSFVKRAENARLTFTITQVIVIAEDYNPKVLRGPTPMSAQVQLDVLAYKDGTSFFEVGGRATVFGGNEFFFGRVYTTVDSQRPLWEERDFDFAVTEGLLPGSELTCPPGKPGTRGTLTLRQPITVSVDLSSVEVGEEFTLHSLVVADALNRRGGGSADRCEASYAGAYIRDPLEIAGNTVEFDGLEPTNRPQPVPPAQPPEPIACESGPDREAGLIQFEAADFVVDEHLGAVPAVALTRSGGSRGRVSVNLSTTDGTATGVADFTPLNTTIVFGDGDTGTRLVEIPAIPDGLVEPDETIQLTLSQPGGCASLGPQSTAMLTIRTQDPPDEPQPGTFTIGGHVTGLVGTGLQLEEVESRAPVSPTTDGEFAFGGLYPTGTTYEVRVFAQPTNPVQICSVANGTGTIAGENVTDVAVNCTTPPASGSLDPEFGGNGKVTASLPATEAMVLQSDGKIVLLGRSSLARYNSDGTVDSTFGTAGLVLVQFLGSSTPTSIALQSDGKIVVGGRSGRALADGLTNFALVRLNTNGSIDTTFGDNGFVYTDFNGNFDLLENVLIQSDGRIVAAGNAAVASGNTGTFINAFAAARYTSDGVLDSSFGNNGLATETATITGEQEVCLARAAALQPDDAIVFAGSFDEGDDDGTDGDSCAMRFTANGQRDAGFGEGGVVVIDYFEGNPIDDDDDQFDAALALVVQPDGRIVLAGQGSNFNEDFLVARLNADGSRDASFGTDGSVRIDFSGEGDIAHAVALQADGAIIVAGVARIPGPPLFAGVPDFAIARLLGNGTLDPSFGNAGKLMIDFFGATDSAEAVAVQSDGRIVVAGGVRNAATNAMGLVRLVP